MTVLRSREIVRTQSRPKTLRRKRAIEPSSTPSKIHQLSSHKFPPAMASTPPSSPHPNLPVFKSDSASLTGALRRRSLRLASKSSPIEGTAKVLVSVSGGHCKRTSSFGLNNNEAEPEKVRVLEVEEGIEEQKIGLGGLGLVVDRVTELGESGFSSDLGDFSFRNEDIVNTTKVKGRRKLSTGIDFSALVVVDSDKEEKGFLNLRSGKRLVTKGIDKGIESDGHKSVHGREGETIVSDGSREGFALKELEKDPSSDQNVGVKTRRRLSSEGKGKGKLVKDGVTLHGIDPLEMDLNPKAGNLIYNASASENGPLKGRKRFTRKEKGKYKLVENDMLSNSNGQMELDLDSEVKTLVNNAVSDANHSPESVALQDGGQVTETNTNVSESTGRYREIFRDIARKNASRFAHFAAQDEEEEEEKDRSSFEAEGEMPSRETVKEVEDWPGPFSTAMKIIKERAVMLNVQQENPSSDKINPAHVLWVPKKSQDHSKPLLPSLKELCLRILAKNADAIASLDNVPDVMRHKLSQLLCDSRRMNNHFFNLLVCGSPTEVRVRDCSWLTEEQFTESFEQCDTNNLTVLQLDQCGRCMLDYILLATLARSLNSLPVLTTISLRGACRLSDTGLSALVSSASALRSINLSQCSLLTSASINALADSLGLVLRELFIDDCQGIDAMLVLPALKKLEHLEVLSLAGLQTVCDDFVKELMIVHGRNMKELVLSDCVKLTDSSLKVIAESCSGLSALDLVNLSKLTDSALGYLANGCLAIQKLKLCRNAFSDEAIAAFLETSGESLQELSLNNVNKVGHNTAISLASHSRKLLSLDLSWCRNLTNEALGLIVDSCLLLRVLKVFGCTQITNVFLDGHSNPKIQIIGLKMTPILKYLEVPDPPEGPLHYSSVPSI